MNELCDQVQGPTILTKINLKLGYNLVNIKQGNKWKTEFRTRYRDFKYLIMLFKLANTPSYVVRYDDQNSEKPNKLRSSSLYREYPNLCTIYRKAYPSS
jgi:hypothetical protein